MEAKIYKKNYLDTNKDIINRLNLLLEENLDDETYYERFNDVYELNFNKFLDFLNAKKGTLKTYGVSSAERPRLIYDYDFDSYMFDYEDLTNTYYYNNYDVAINKKSKIDENKIYRIFELLRLVEEGKIVLLEEYFREEVMNDDIFMDETNKVNTFSKYPFSDFSSLDSKTKELTMRIIHTLVPNERIQNDINNLSNKVKKLGTMK